MEEVLFKSNFQSGWKPLMREREPDAITTYMSLDTVRQAKHPAKHEAHQHDRMPVSAEAEEKLQGCSLRVTELENRVQEQSSVIQELTQHIESMRTTIALLEEKNQVQQVTIDALTAYIKAHPSIEKKGFFATRRRAAAYMNTID